MSDSDRDPPGAADRVRETERTTVVQTGGRDRGRGSGLLVALLLLVAMVALLFFLFGGGLNRAGDEVGVDVDVETPEIKAPDIQVKLPDVDVPEIDPGDVDTGDDGGGNKSE